jgi:C1A family cysteine protease
VVDLRNWASPVEDQLELGSCSSNALAGAYELMTRHLSPADYVDVSRLFIYYNIRLIEDSILSDAGGYLRDGIKALKQYGVCTETLWPYDIEKFDDKPTDACYEDAKKRIITGYAKVVDTDAMVAALNDDKPVVFGTDIYKAFDRIGSKDPVIPMPKEDEYSLGGHAMCLVGYDLPKKLFLARNSFGVDWGDQGYVWIPFEYMDEYGYDAWVFDIPLNINPQ